MADAVPNWPVQVWVASGVVHQSVPSPQTVTVPVAPALKRFQVTVTSVSATALETTPGMRFGVETPMLTGTGALVAGS